MNIKKFFKSIFKKENNDRFAEGKYVFLLPEYHDTNYSGKAFVVLINKKTKYTNNLFAYDLIFPLQENETDKIKLRLKSLIEGTKWLDIHLRTADELKNPRISSELTFSELMKDLKSQKEWLD